MKLMLITGSHPRHDKFVESVANHYEINSHIRVIREEMIPPPPEGLNSRLTDLWKLHFRRRDEAEAKWFGKPVVRHRGRTCIVKQGHLNGDVAVRFVENNMPDTALIFGTDIIKEPLFSTLPAYKINMHLGIIPNYKGSITMFWPQYFLEPAMAGCSWHIIEKLVDTGEVLHQVTPELAPEDGLHDVSCKAVRRACADVGLVLQHVEERLTNGILPKPDPSLATRGKTFIKKDWKPQMLELIYGVYNDRIAQAYLEGKLPQRKPKLTQL
jgi:hypothetical protein